MKVGVTNSCQRARSISSNDCLPIHAPSPSSYSEVMFELERFLHLLPSSKQDMHTSARERIYTPGAACSVAVVRGSDAALCGCARVGAPPSPERSSKSLLVEGESVKPSVLRRFFIGSSITCGDARSSSVSERVSLGTDFLPRIGFSLFNMAAMRRAV